MTQSHYRYVSSPGSRELHLGDLDNNQQLEIEIWLMCWASLAISDYCLLSQLQFVDVIIKFVIVSNPGFVALIF